jgi:hypothetical protein
MGWFWWIAIVAGLSAIGPAIADVIERSKKNKKTRSALAPRSGFNPQYEYKSHFDGSGIAIDVGSKKVAISNGERSRLLDYDDIAGVEILRDGSSVLKTNRGSQVAGAAVGAAFLGPVGLLLGGLSASKRTVEKIDKLSLRIVTTDIRTPVYEIVFFGLPGTGVDEAIVKVASEELSQWHARLQNIVASLAP